MGSRLVLSAAALLVAFAFPVRSEAADGMAAHAKRHARHYHYNHGYFFGPVGGYRFWWQNQPFPYNDQNDYPGHYNNQTFWERVETQRNYPVGY